MWNELCQTLMQTLIVIGHYYIPKVHLIPHFLSPSIDHSWGNLFEFAFFRYNFYLCLKVAKKHKCPFYLEIYLTMKKAYNSN